MNDSGHAHHHHAEDEGWRMAATLATLCGILGTIGLLLGYIERIPAGVSTACYLLAMIAGGWEAAGEAWPNLRKGRLEIHFLMLAVAVGASVIGAFGEGALLLFLFSMSGALEHFALHRTRREIHALFHLAPRTATLLDTTTRTERTVDVDAISTNDLLLIRPGDVFPVDGKVEDGNSASDESSLTGEARPAEKGPGDPVYSGTINLWGALEVRCLRPAGESSLQKVIHLIQQARHLRAPSQRFTDRFGPAYTIGVLAATTAMFFIWWFVLDVPPFRNGEGTYAAFYRAMTLLVVASPCALVLSIPSAILAAIAWGARHGILFRGGAAIEELAGIQVVAMDKTGTLTTGDLRVARVESFPPGRERAVAERAFSLEQKASHPIARAILRYGQEHQLQAQAIAEFRTLPGQGVQAHMNGEHSYLGRRDLLDRVHATNVDKAWPDAPDGLSEVWLVHGDLVGRILLEDQIRDESSDVLQQLHRDGLRVVMVTGDRPEAARAVADKLGLRDVHSGLTPEQKVQTLTTLKAGGVRVAMIGDGINDAPSLAAADVAVAMGARGSDAALEQSDVVLMDDKIANFHTAYRLSRKARTIIRQNLVISLGTIAVMVSAAFLGIVPITVGVIAHEGSTVIVCLNSLRLLRGPNRQT